MLLVDCIDTTKGRFITWLVTWLPTVQLIVGHTVCFAVGVSNLSKFLFFLLFLFSEKNR